MITIKDIAHESGYSVGTVSRVLNGREGVSDTARETVMGVVRKYNFRLNENAKLLKQQGGRGIVIIVKGTQNMLYDSMLVLMQKLITEKGYECSVFYLNEKDNEVRSARRIYREKKPEGIVFLGANLRFFRDGIDGIDAPCVLVTASASELGLDNVSSVSIDDEGAAYYAIERLISKGHTRIGIIGGSFTYSSSSGARLRGCCRAFERNGVPFDQSSQYQAGFFTFEGGYKAANVLFRKMPDVTAIFAMSDVTAIGTMRAAADRGMRIPEDLSLVGFDGVTLAEYTTPRLATIRQNREELSSASAELLLAMVRGEQQGRHILVPFTPMEGDSVRDIKKKRD